MFGMGDPAQVIDQYRKYVGDNRLEIAEVMSSELAEMLHHKREKSVGDHGHLVDALRDLSTITEMRGKWDESRAAAGQLAKARARFVKALRKAGLKDAAATAAACEVGDEIQRGRVAMHAGRKGAALGHFKRARKGSAAYLEAVLRPIEVHHRCDGTLRKAAKPVLAACAALARAGPVNRISGTFQLQPEGGPAIPLAQVLEDMTRWLNPALALPAKAQTALTAAKAELERQVAAIEAGEQAANARLAAAIDSLEPALDYHEYSK